MASDYEAIRSDNIRDYGEKTHHLDFLGRLYSDRTHFIYELLQNAEDKGASKVLYQLFDDRLEVKHDGEIFSECDVRGICGVGEGTKAGDLTKIGKFGIGFKAVYAYTSMPEVHSGDEHFRIENYVRPYLARGIDPGDGWTTLFVLRFDSAEIPVEAACEKIKARLCGLTARTLLFLRKIRSIDYILPDGVRGTYLRESRGGAATSRRVALIGKGGGGNEDQENWLVFERLVAVPESDDTVAVEVAFKLETASENQTEGIARIKQSPLYVFFPTEKETNFGFLIQGPYRTTPARDNIPRDDPWNSTLVDETAALTVEALHHTKALGLLTVALLNAMPIRMERFPADDMFLPIVSAVRAALRNDELLPADDGTFVAAQNASIARGADLRTLLSSDQLRLLYLSTDEKRWLSGEITEDRTPDLRDYLRTELKVDELDAGAFARRISRDFLARQTDEWFIELFGYLSGQEALWRAPRWRGEPGGVLRSAPILRLQDNALEVPFRSDGEANAYLPPPETTDFPVVKREIAADGQAADFLKRLGLTQPDIFDDIVRRVLPKYAAAPTMPVSSDEHAEDIRKVLRALGSDSESGKAKVIEAAKETPFIRATDLGGNASFKRPGEIYRDSSELRAYFETSPNVWFLDEAIFDDDADERVWESLGVARRPRRVLLTEIPDGIEERSTQKEEIHNYTLDGLDNFLAVINKSEDFDDRKRRAAILWRFLGSCIDDDPRFFDGRYKWFYYTQHSKRFDSQLLTKLREAEWIPTRGRDLKRPIGLPVTELFDDFCNAADLIKRLGMRFDDEVERQQHASELGVSLEDIDVISQHPEEFGKWKSSLGDKAQLPTFPTRTSSDPQRRQERLSEQWMNKSDKSYEERERSVRTTRGEIDPRPWLIDLYTNDAKQMVCQLCKKEMPFRKRDGNYYFEAVEALSREHFSKEHEAQFLALCPVCAAKFNEFVKTDEVAMMTLRKSLLSSDEPEIPLDLAGSPITLSFVEMHFKDIQTILYAALKE